MRYERKFRTVHLSPQQVRSLIRLHPRGFYEVHPPREINNLYLDTLGLNCFSESLDGVRDRTKVRIRWYGERFGWVEKPVLEFKFKRGFLGDKRRFDLEPFEMKLGFDRIAVRELLRKTSLPKEFEHAVRAADVTVMNRYHRTYFLSRDGKFRFTMDTDMNFCDARHVSNQFLGASSHPDEIVLELKYEQEHDKEAHLVSNGFPFRITRNSKYANGVERACLW